MSYNLTINGHKDGLGEAEAREFEEAVRDKALTFVASLEGVSTAQGSFGIIGPQNLKAEE